MRPPGKRSALLLGFAATALCTAAARADDIGPLLSDRPLVLELNAGVPKLASNDFAVIGDATVGYRGASFGVIGRGAFAAFDFTSPQQLSNNTRTGGSGEGYYLFGDEREMGRFELRASGGATVYDSEFIPLVNIAQQGRLRQENSLMARGNGLLGVRLRPSDALGLSALVGGGLQLESYDLTTVDAAGKTQVGQSDHRSFRLEWRLGVISRVVPDAVSLRLRTEGSIFSITRDQLDVTAGGGASTTLAQASTQLRQLESLSRLNVDIDKLELLGALPSVFFGLDVVTLRGSGGSLTTVIPSAGIGVVTRTDSAP